MVGIYLITNKINGKTYIGKSKQLERRWGEHISNANSKSKRLKNYHLYNAMKRYGIGNFDFSILCECEESELNLLEKSYIAQYKSNDPKIGYNKTTGGDGGDTFTSRLEESKSITRIKLRRVMEEELKGISAKSKKGEHITQSNPEIKEKWDKNFKDSMEKLSARRSAGNFTKSEQIAYDSLKESRKGKGNPMYKGSYTIFNSLGEEVGKYDSLRIIVREVGWPYTSLNKCVLSGQAMKMGKFKGYTVTRELV